MGSRRREFPAPFALPLPPVLCYTVQANLPCALECLEKHMGQDKAY